jgi:hypothetical protein
MPPPLGKKGKWLLAALLLFAVVLIGLPYAVGYGVRHVLTGMGATSVTLQNVDLNPFSGTIALEGLQVNGDGSTGLTAQELFLDLAWLPLARKTISIERITLRGIELGIAVDAHGALTVAGLSLPAPEKTSDAVETPTTPRARELEKFTIANTHIGYTDPVLSSAVTIDEMQLTGITSAVPEQAAHLTLSGKINDAPLTVTATLQPFLPEPAVSADVKLKQLSLSPFQPLAADLLTSLAGTLGVDLHLTARQTAAGLALTKQGRITLDNLAVASQGIHLAQGSLTWQGKTTVADNGDTRVEGDLNLAQVALTRPDQNLLLASLDSLAVEGIQLTELGDLTVDQLRADGLSAVQDTPKNDTSIPVLRAGKITLQKLAVDHTGNLNLADLSLSDIWATLHRNADGELPAITRLSGALPETTPDTKPDPATTPASIETTKPGPATVIRLGHASIGGDSGVAFLDEGVTPPFNLRLAIRSASISDLDSSAKTPANMAFEGTIGDYTGLTLNGQASPLADPISLDLNGQISALELPPLSAYTAELLGYNLNAGTMDANLTIKVDTGTIDGETRLTINQLELVAASEEKMGRLTTELTMPLDAALSLLRDKNDNITLTIPLTGTMDDPSFEIGKVVNKALGSALKKGAMSYLKMALQPYGAILTVAKMAAGAVTAVHLDPVLFVAGAKLPGADADPYLEKIAGLLTERDGIAIKLCGTATESDRVALTAPMPTADEASVDASKPATSEAVEVTMVEVMMIVPSDETLATLAKDRARAIKQQLVTDYGISPERLFVCHPEIDTQADALPRVELLI